MPDIKSELEKALDESLEDLQKAAAGEETISKAAKSEEKEEEEVKGEKPAFLKKKGEKDEKKDEGEDEDAKGDKKDEEKDEDEETMRGGVHKSVEETLSKSESVSGAIEVSKFLRELVKSQAEVLGDVMHRVRKLEKSNKALAEALVKSQTVQVEVLKSIGSGVVAASRQPLPRKSISAGATIEKSFRNNEGTDENKLSKSQVADRLSDLEIGLKVPMGTTSRYEMTGELSKSFEKLVMEFEK